MIALSMVSFWPQPPLWLDLVAELRMIHLVPAVLLYGLACLLRSRRALIATGIALAIDIIWVTIPFYVPAFLWEHAIDGAPRLKLVAANIDGAHNKRYADFANYVKSEDPDIVVISEYSGDWHDELLNRLPQFDHLYFGKRPGPTAVLSRIPMAFFEWGTGGEHFGVRGVFTFGNQSVLMIATHPPAIHNVYDYNRRNGELVHVAELVAEATTPVILAGDLNTAPWTYWFDQLVKVRLLDSEIGHGLQCSWSALMPVPIVPIDHCLHTREFDVLDRHVGTRFGSDHYPIAVTLQLHSARH